MDLMFKTVYKSFRQNLNYIIDDTDVISKEQLKFLMAQRGFRKKKDGTRLYPSEKQLTLAWEYVSSRSRKKVKLETMLYRIEKYKFGTRKRVMVKEIKYGKKTYRKGQFLPSKYKDKNE